MQGQGLHCDVAQARPVAHPSTGPAEARLVGKNRLPRLRPRARAVASPPLRLPLSRAATPRVPVSGVSVVVQAPGGCERGLPEADGGYGRTRRLQAPWRGESAEGGLPPLSVSLSVSCMQPVIRRTHFRCSTSRRSRTAGAAWVKYTAAP